MEKEKDSNFGSGKWSGKRVDIHVALFTQVRCIYFMYVCLDCICMYVHVIIHVTQVLHVCFTSIACTVCQLEASVQ